MSGPARIAAAFRLIALVSLLVLPASQVHTAQSQDDEEVSQVAPDWLSAESAAQLAVGINVLLPEVIPGPFEGEPDITAYDGYYSLYWLLPGSPPTYLQINGEAGGEIPDFSWYDRNVQLEVNAEVQGYPAYHDLTPIYDLVYWQVGDVVYSVESSNLVDTDSLTLANSLSLLAAANPEPIETPDEGVVEPPDETGEPSVTVPATMDAGDIITVEVSNANGATLTASAGTFTDSGSDSIEGVTDGSFNWQAPAVVEDTYLRVLLVDPESQEWVALAEATVIGTHVAPTASLSCPSPLDPEVVTPITLSGNGTITIEATGGSFPPNPRNLDFASDADGSSSMTGAVPEGGAIDIYWQAPPVDEDTVFSIIASDADGVTLASCDITLIAYAPPTEEVDVPESGEGLPGGPLEEPTEVPIEEPGEEPVEPPADEPVGDPSDTPIEESDSTPRPTRTPRSTPTAKPSSPTPAVKPTTAATVAPTATSGPVTGPSGMVAQVIGPEGGQLSHPAGATVIIPPGALSDESTVTIMAIEDTSLPVTDRVDFVSRTGFDISLADATGRPVETLAKTATLTIELKPDQWRRDTVLYWIHESRQEVLAGAQLTDAEVSAPLEHFSRFAAGVPIAGTENSNRLLYLIAAAVGVVLIAICYGVVTVSRRQRTLRVGPRRVPARNRRS